MLQFIAALITFLFLTTMAIFASGTILGVIGMVALKVLEYFNFISIPLN